ncbi:hypothetical protein EMIHUDRAFT_451622 [Emiliania huxleyi CCMP1516]|uniref:Uncharacterized protein n=2 Tax=Emiliania huxleyi TaxID=2903 RepID=A0A0D3IXN1_EMIH1|nr:hypothetical protein EMIHUDRAFT_451622 [Emiliania huxleyi CCMP1516]EOD16016.1 hypothetical protein EMIHUDRAFT_451622 [Emiliania huxleyi CCMP1516]|eukprot:XP_005768445.1 hypothetical protein EMIHUDRAFT_451622 [Emiliania huxleyi CCMP1516]
MGCGNSKGYEIDLDPPVATKPPAATAEYGAGAAAPFRLSMGTGAEAGSITPEGTFTARTETTNDGSESPRSEIGDILPLTPKRDSDAKLLDHNFMLTSLPRGGMGLGMPVAYEAPQMPASMSAALGPVGRQPHSSSGSSPRADEPGLEGPPTPLGGFGLRPAFSAVANPALDPAYLTLPRHQMGSPRYAQEREEEAKELSSRHSSQRESNSYSDSSSEEEEEEEAPTRAKPAFKLNMSAVERDEVDGSKPVAAPHTCKEDILKNLMAEGESREAAAGGKISSI